MDAQFNTVIKFHNIRCHGEFALKVSLYHISKYHILKGAVMAYLYIARPTMSFLCDSGGERAAATSGDPAAHRHL